MNIRTILFSLSVVLLFSACAPKSLSIEKVKSISSIGVVSLHGNKIESIERGITIFGNEDTISDISSWKIDKYVVDEVQNILKDRKYKVVPILLTEEQIVNYDSAQTVEFRESFLKKLLDKYNVDALMLLVRGNYVPETYDITRGVAIIKAKALGMEATSIKFNLYLEGTEISNGKFETLHFNHIRAFGELDNSLWIDTTKPITQENLEKIEPKVKELLKGVLSAQIKDIGY